MERLVLLLFIWAGVFATQAQEGKVSQNLSSFKELKVFDGLSVNLIRSDKNQAVITGANTSKVAIVNTDGVLKIRMEIGKIFSGYRTFIDLYYTQDLVVIDVNEDARITTKEALKQDVVELKAQEGGEISIQAQVEQLLIKSVTGGVINASGTSDNQDVQINTGGVYKGKDLKTKFTTVNVNAGSSAEIYATSYVKVSVKAGGTVFVYGDPDKMEEKTVFGGKIERM
ncbi:head GIN domain-containing protein [Muriicola sp.]|uniref:head GIN domain-containing protein n=1 Tax=Muriicola sp. TaxID=2020856 RepID=UPI003C748625